MTSPLSDTDALQHLKDALGSTYAAPKDDPTLTRALGVDTVTVDGQEYPRPWATAARLIADNTEYEVGGELAARIDRKLASLRRTQHGMDVAAGISAYVPTEIQAWPPVGGVVPTEGTY
ncbi:hypothetical protein DKM44_02295 [Deinococcus irradiatisoli]|uniref:Uncharacterized protein n=1 Tax=Deinococcus irradiatisoli TaxID=2202254 RepID=A0A2Z3JJV5_9DEIO|nr:hypothetical protein [Deinococcus irradiatisoli]AWN22208.1 hypothetical protein DKM44_02295 [Deinococcus irradiatisoli]